MEWLFLRSRFWLCGALVCSLAVVACDERGDAPEVIEHDGGDAAHAADSGDAGDAAMGSIDAATPDAQVAPGDDAQADAQLPDDARVDASLDGGDDAGTEPDARVGTPPASSFSLSSTTGAGTLWVRATSAATAGSEPIVEVLYDFGDGAGLAPAATHRYTHAGSFVVRQQVRDAAGVLASSTANVTVAAFTPVRFSATNRASNMLASADGYRAENRSGLGGIRTDAAIAPGSGVFYFEGTLIAPVRVGGFGVTAQDAPLDQGAGGNALSLGYEAYGPLRNTGSVCTGASTLDGSKPLVGFVIDYRASTPTVHLVQQGSGHPDVIASCAMTVTAPLYAVYWSERATVGYEARINTGQDTVNDPFAFTLGALQDALVRAGHPDAAAALVPGFGSSRTGRVNELPALTVPAAQQVPFGQPVTLNASAIDAEDGDLSAQISWVDTASLWHARVAGSGASFTFTPNAIGRHPLEVSVTDLDGGAVVKTVMVTVTGALPQANPVRLQLDATSGEGVSVSVDGLSATFAGPGKDGVKANQGVYGDFWYFEVHRINPIRNMGLGLMVQEGSLNPYDFHDVPWSVSLNVMQGLWRELIPFDQYMGQAGDTDFGWAVDYRGEHPQVYVIARGTLLTHYDLTEVWTPLYPIVYGNVAYPAIPGPDVSINFGTTPFAFDPKAILSTAGVDASALKLGWGVHAH